MNLNRVFIAGRLTRDVELRQTQDGKAVGKFGIAVNHKWGDKESTVFLDCVAFGTSAENLAKHLSKGSPLFFEGRLSFSSWEDQQGQKRSKLEAIVEHWQFIGPRQDGDKANAPARASAGERSQDYGDVPF